MITGLSHVSIAVPSIEAASKRLKEVYGLEAGAVRVNEQQGVRLAYVELPNARIELMEPARPDSPISGFLAKRGGGIHHLAWKVDDVAAAIAALRAKGIRMIDEAPRPGAHGTRIAFVHPKSTGGVLMELVQEPRADGA